MAENIGLELYERLYLARRAEQRIIDLYPEDDMKTPMHMSLGQEAVPAAVATALKGRGDVVTTYRTHAPFLSVTGDVDAFFGELYGRTLGYAEGKGGSMHLAYPEKGHLCSTAIVGGGFSIAVGAAFANKFLRNGRVSVVFFGDGAVEEGSFWESLNVAATMMLPVLFVCEDNGLAVHTRQSVRHGFHSLADVIAGFKNFRFDFDDSNDAEALQARAAALVEYTSNGNGPAFLHAKCFRYLEHVGINEDFHESYRSREEMDIWRDRDGVESQRERLIARGLAGAVDAIEAQVNERIEAAIAKAKASPQPEAERLFAGVFK